MHSDRRKNTSPQAQPADVSPDTGLDRGFGQMLQQAAISSELIAELSVERDAGAVSLLEEALLQRWPVEGYGDIIRNPAAGLHALEADYGRFVADAEVLVRDLAQFDIAEVIDIRFPVGVRLEWSRFEHSDLMLGQLWLAEARMLEWLCDEAARVESLCRLARPYALARTALEMEAATGQTRRPQPPPVIFTVIC
ncbi:hypothetical protein [Marinobacterium aestuariivivens]|uniref:Uncharacterized protein n=1 Tax=Marinobacterium aestuariivivens TaxID=1698799 RepID=A0ABW2A584_9GAMM